MEMDKDIFWDHFWIKHKVSITDHADNNVKATLPGELQLYYQTVYPNVSGIIGNLDFSLCFFQSSVSHDVLCI